MEKIITQKITGDMEKQKEDKGELITQKINAVMEKLKLKDADVRKPEKTITKKMVSLVMEKLKSKGVDVRKDEAAAVTKEDVKAIVMTELKSKDYAQKADVRKM